MNTKTKTIWSIVAGAMMFISLNAYGASASGNIAGTLENMSSGTYSVNAADESTGRSRDTGVSGDGDFRFTQLPIGTYVLSVSHDGNVVARDTFKVTLNGTTTALFPLEQQSASIEEIVVTASAPSYDTYATDSGLVLDEEELDLLPIARNLTAVSLLAPGVVLGESKFGLSGGTGFASFGGSSISENSCYINGLEVTNTSQGLGCGAVPFEFYDQFQVKTGGYSAQYGRTTGGVLNAVTKSGSNDWEFGVGVAYEPTSLYEEGKVSRGSGGLGNGFGGVGTGRVFRDSTEDVNGLTEYWITAGGPIVRDHLFVYALVNPRDEEQNFSNYTGNAETSRDTEYRYIEKSGSDNIFWGAKVDWDINDYHRFSVWGYSNRNDGIDTHFGKDSVTNEIEDQPNAEFTRRRGGEAVSASYTGTFFDNLTLHAMWGEINAEYTNEPDRENFDVCPRIRDLRTPAPAVPISGCGPGGSEGDNMDTNEQVRLDLEWAVGNHLIRAGLDKQDRSTKHLTSYIGGFRWDYETIAPGANIQGNAGPLWTNETSEPVDIVNSRYFDNSNAGGNFSSELTAYYVEDEWQLNDNIVLYLGARQDSLTNYGGTGIAFADFEQDWAPRLGLSWDPTGDGQNKLYSTWGRYYLPVLNNTNFRVAAGVTDQRTYYTYTGTNPVTGEPTGAVGVNGTPENSRITNSDGITPNQAQFQAAEADPFYKTEFIIGYEKYVNDENTISLRYVNREVGATLDDYCGPLANQNFCTLVNPGSGGTWEDADGVVRFHAADEIKLPEGDNTYHSVQLQWDHAGYKTNYSFIYVWGQSFGNFEGAVKSDIQQPDAGITQDFDFPALMDGADGYLANDRRHALKFFGSYRITDDLVAGWSASATSGRPLNLFGQGYPDDAADIYGSYGDTFYLFTNTCNLAGGGVGACDGTEAQSAKIYEQNTRGAGGRTPWNFTLDASLSYAFELSKVGFVAQLQVFNLLDIQEVTSVNEHVEVSEGVANEFYGTPFAWQQPRHVRLTFQARF
jgi:outer membrane receptor for ferrienterochelin and colicin